MKHGSAFRGNSVCVWAEVSRGHSSYSTEVVSEGLNIESREETCALNSERADRFSRYWRQHMKPALANNGGVCA